MRKSILLTVLVLVAITGAVDAGYLSYEHFQNKIPPCTTGSFSDCGKVLQSKYSVVAGIPLALLGLFHYVAEAVVLIISTDKTRSNFRKLAIILSGMGFVFSAYFVFLMVFVIGAICPYCLASAVISTILFLLIPNVFEHERKQLTYYVLAKTYKYLLKPLFFLVDPEIIHVNMTQIGHFLGSMAIARKINNYLLNYSHPALRQTIAGIQFINPIGLAAGFDYEAKLPMMLPSLGFGFGSVGTITNHAYAGNPTPRLGRLPKSKSLMVNKGFKNDGARQTIKHLGIKTFSYPVGVSIGRTNSLQLSTYDKSIADICNAFTLFEQSSVHHHYYELNISCPNLLGDISFYPARNLENLLTAIDLLKLSRPLFIKMPIDRSDRETLTMLKVISKHSPAGVIIGNLQKNRRNAQLIPAEVAKFPVGNFSGKPCFERSNHLISLAYKHFSKRFIIIGCGGVFSAQDAYEKIARGASLIQLITGMIFEGPQLIPQINMDLVRILSAHGFSNIQQAVGSKYKYGAARRQSISKITM